MITYDIPVSVAYDCELSKGQGLKGAAISLPYHYHYVFYHSKLTLIAFLTIP
jgi:hypothetical protein